MSGLDGCVTVILDTGPARDLAHSSTAPEWVASLSQMKSDGYHFSLADNACAELINQRSRGSIDDLGFANMIRRLDTFLDPTLPVMLGGKDILRSIGVEPADPEVGEMSRKAWSALCQQQVCLGCQAGQILDEERGSWKELFQKKLEAMYVADGRPANLDELDHPILDAVLASLNERVLQSPPLSVRFDLRTRYVWRQFVRSRKEDNGYNVDAPKKRNDGIDFTVYTYLALPALVIATDRGFHAAISDIPSFQTAWFHKPESLADAWRRGVHPRPEWPCLP